ncbi:MAG: 4-aminobutyrate aminotransferase/(S)-3-amino-2-methylpropionate transaminase, partial [Gammaproteobacteria bacterium]
MSDPQLKIADPASLSNSDWQTRKNDAVARGQGNLASVFVDHASGSEIWDVEGRRYIDFGSGIAVCSAGHTHPKITAAVAAQLDKFSHTCVMVTPYNSSVQLAEKLNELAPGKSKKKSIFVTTGAEAVENAVKIARAHTRRRGVIAFNGGYHGRTIMAMGMTGKITPYKNLFGPFPAEIYHAPFPIEYHGITVEDSLKALNNLFTVDIAPDDVAAIIVEPIQGEGGFYAAPVEFMQALRALCDEHGIVMICDEIQTGFARTGKMFCTEYSDIEPDICTVAKGMANGFPIA